MPTNEDLSVALAGALAASRLKQVKTGRVFALFDRSLYLELPTGLICLASADLEPGVLVANLAAPGPLARYRQDQSLTLSLGRAEPWRPPPLTKARQAQQGCAALIALARAKAPEEGFSFFWGRDGEGGIARSLARRAKPAIEALEVWLADPIGPPPDNVYHLLGLGPGLTPSGDDFLAGLLFTLTLLRQERARERLAKAILGSKAFHAISRELMTAAAQGQGNALMHDLLNALLDGSDLEAFLPRFQAAGHSSAWDCAAGMLTALKIQSQSMR